FVGRRLRRALIWISCLVSMIAGVFFLANYVWALDAQLLAEIDKYEPSTPEAERASEAWASDTDRSFLLLLSPVLTGGCYSGLFLLIFGWQWVQRRRSREVTAGVLVRPSDSDQSRDAAW
ncbi:MAG: hypothetical protein KDA85_22200, partial [Planctomycetaceae bacterium]|nr:hypothetical protein [Planctomycetaceae bacterium]